MGSLRLPPTRGKKERPVCSRQDAISIVKASTSAAKSEACEVLAGRTP